jgi:hypothetical protein
MSSNLFDVLAYMYRKVLLVPFLALSSRVGVLFSEIVSCLGETEINFIAIITFCNHIFLPSPLFLNSLIAVQILLLNI